MQLMKKWEGGFSQIELLVSLTLTGIITVLIVNQAMSMLRLGMEWYDRVTLDSQVMAINGVLERDLRDGFVRIEFDSTSILLGSVVTGDTVVYRLGPGSMRRERRLLTSAGIEFSGIKIALWLEPENEDKPINFIEWPREFLYDESSIIQAIRIDYSLIRGDRIISTSFLKTINAPSYFNPKRWAGEF